MERTNVTAEGVGDLYVATDREGGVLDRLGIDEQTPLHAALCPDCGLTRSERKPTPSGVGLSESILWQTTR